MAKNQQKAENANKGENSKVLQKIIIIFNDCVAAVSCIPDAYRFSWGGIWDLVDGQAGPCMISVHGWCMSAWHPGGLS